MIFIETELKGAFLIEPEPHADERGSFTRLWCEQDFSTHGLCTRWVQGSLSCNPRTGTLRGMHYQAPPHSEAKLVCCVRGAIYDVIIDLRRTSLTFGKHLAVQLSGHNRRLLYIPEEFAHGFQTLEDHSDVLYQMSTFYAPEAARGIRWNDPAFAIHWPQADRLISARDQQYPDFCRERLLRKTHSVSGEPEHREQRLSR
jgi:dTDP-4-dehydrorhamnose 3,5-epimerase